jgi:hypothetical protein
MAKYTCPNCDYTTDNEWNYRQHINWCVDRFLRWLGGAR